MLSDQIDIWKFYSKPQFRLGLGTYQLKNPFQVALEAIDIGYRHIDTAALYRNEEHIGQAIRESGISRNDLFITTKVWTSEIKSNRIRESIEKSLQKLGQINLILLHAPTPNVLSAWNSICDAATEFQIPFVGVSNFGVSHLSQLPGPIPAVNQIELSPFLQRREIVDYCQKQKILVQAHSPLTKGIRIDDARLCKMAETLNLAPTAILLKWCTSKNVQPIAKSQNPNHLRENMEAVASGLPNEAVQKLDELEENFATHPQHID